MNESAPKFKMLECSTNAELFLENVRKIQGADQYLDETDAFKIVSKLQTNSIDYSGECSSQRLYPTIDGNYLRIGITDEDVAEFPGYWFDYYEGLKIK